MNITRAAAHFAALGLAAAVTLGALFGMDRLANVSYDAALAAATPVQQIVIVGQRQPNA